MLRYYLKSAIYLFCRWILHKKYLTAYTPKFDLYFKFKTEDVIGRHIFKKGIYEEDLTNFLIQNLKFEENDLVFDIGANIGWYAMLLHKVSPASVSIYAFEPDPLNFSLLEANVKKNKADNVKPHQKAIADSTGIQTLYLYPSKNQGRHSLLPINSDKQVQVSTIMLDQFIIENNLNFADVKFLKIDVEGYEYFAFMGAKQVLEHVPYILSEYSPNYMRKGKVVAKDLLDLLFNYSFVPYLIVNQNIVEISKEEILGKEHNINIFWKKNFSS